MGMFPSSYGCHYILVAVDCVFQWEEVQALSINDAREVIEF